MKTDIKGNVCIITGAGTGIGKEVAIRLATLGVKVVLLGGRNKERLENTCKEICEYGECIFIPGDLTDSKVQTEGINKAIEKFGKIDYLINNAGLAMNGRFDTVSEELYDEIFNLDVKVPFFMSQKVLPYLRKSKNAAIINIASVVAHSGYPNQSVYAMAKHALLGFSKSMANELYKENIRVHVVSPGGVLSEMVALTRPDLKDEPMIVPDDISDAIEFFLTHRTNAVIDEIQIHRVGKAPFSV